MLWLPVALNYQSDALKNGRRGINRCMIRLQTSEFERVSTNVSHERLCQVQLAKNKFFADKNLVKLNFSYRKYLLGFENRLKLNISQIVRMNRCATGRHQTNQKLVKKMSKT